MRSSRYLSHLSFPTAISVTAVMVLPATCPWSRHEPEPWDPSYGWSAWVEQLGTPCQSFLLPSSSLPSVHNQEEKLSERAPYSGVLKRQQWITFLLGDTLGCLHAIAFVFFSSQWSWGLACFKFQGRFQGRRVSITWRPGHCSREREEQEGDIIPKLFTGWLAEGLRTSIVVSLFLT